MTILERVTFTVGDSVSSCQPQIQTIDSTASKDYIEARPFEIGDFERVLDFDINPSSPPDTILRLGESHSFFPLRYFCLRGCFLFYFQEEDVSQMDKGGVLYIGKPLGVIPLDRTHIDFPEGGRRVFQKHANSNASKGYEFVVGHTPRKDSNDVKRRDEYLVADTSSQREEWKLALSSRSGGILKDTVLRPGGSVQSSQQVVNSSEPSPKAAFALSSTCDLSKAEDRSSMLNRSASMNFTSQRGKSRPNLFDYSALVEDVVTQFGDMKQSKNPSQKNQQPPQQDTLSILDNDLLEKFTDHRFDSDSYTNQFFVDNIYNEADVSCREMESALLSVKRGLRGAVLEQYKYFVQASQEMKIMGKEVAALQQTCAEQLVTLVDGMKGINFAEAFAGEPVVDDFEGYSDEEDDDTIDNDAEAEGEVVSLNNLSDNSFHSSDEEQESPGRIKVRWNDTSTSKLGNRRKISKSPLEYSKDYDVLGNSGAGHPLSPSSSTVGSQVEIPPWLADVTEEISAFKKECRYTEATNLSIKAKTEVTEFLSLHEKALRHQQLTKKQQTSLRRILMEIESLITSLGDRLVETLRRKNEALKQTYKRERQDPLYELTPLISPVCLEDDASALHLLVKLGRPHDAAVAYSVRRSMQLSECLNERPIANSGLVTTDVVIYACQLSQGYFSRLADAVEGFLDLFSGAESSPAIDRDIGEDTSLVAIASKKVPARAMANIVLWCDQELVKFASTFGGSRILGRLALTPASGAAESSTVKSGAELSQGTMHTGPACKQSCSSSIPELKGKLREAEEMGDYALAGSLRRKLGKAEEFSRIDERSPRDALKAEHKSPQGADNDRQSDAPRRGAYVSHQVCELVCFTPFQTALEVAAKSVDHAFTSASKNLDSIGLPVLCRLAECIRPRLKGCESEVAALLPESWQHIVFSWAPSEKTFAHNLLRCLDNKGSNAVDADATASSVSSRRSSRRNY